MRGESVRGDRGLILAAEGEQEKVTDLVALANEAEEGRGEKRLSTEQIVRNFYMNSFSPDEKGKALLRWNAFKGSGRLESIIARHTENGIKEVDETLAEAIATEARCVLEYLMDCVPRQSMYEGMQPFKDRDQPVAERTLEGAFRKEDATVLSFPSSPNQEEGNGHVLLEATGS